MKNLAKAFLGFILVFAYHIPKLIYRLLLFSYATVFNRQENLTADPKKHLRRAKKLLKKDNAHLLYVALEIRLAIERMTDTEVAFASNASRKMIKKNDPVKKGKYLRTLDEDTDYPHKIMIANKNTGEEYEFGQYKPLDIAKVTEIKGKLGNLLHAQHRIPYGIRNHPWYKETKQFLTESADYLLEVVDRNTPFFALEHLNNVKMVKEGDD